MTFGEKLQKLRKQNGLSQEQLAEKLNVSRQAISKWEMGSIPDMNNVVKLGRYFDCSLDYLMNNEIDTTNETTKNPTVIQKEHKNIVPKVISIAGIFVGIILLCLMPLFAKLYQAFEFNNTNQCFTDSTEYIFRFPLLGVVLVAVLFLSAGIGGLCFWMRKR